MLISEYIEKGRSENLTLVEITRNVSKKFNFLSVSRSALIARTETHNAASFADFSYHKTLKDDLGMKMVKRWSATNDERTRDAHIIANGQTVDMEPYSSEKYKLSKRDSKPECEEVKLEAMQKYSPSLCKIY